MKNVGVLFGGRSAEHKISIISALSIIEDINFTKHNVTPIYIDTKGEWHFFPTIYEKHKVKNSINTIKKYLKKRDLHHSKGLQNILHLNKKLDVIFPIIHGTLGEDGTMQGLLECLDIPYIGANVLSSAISMDKVTTKLLLSKHAINVTPFIYISEYEYKNNVSSIIQKIEKLFEYPIFIKPSNSGSSIAINKAYNTKELIYAIKEALLYDKKILIEKAITAREIEVSVLENIDDYGNPIVSSPGEVIPNDDFYTYKAKYLMKNGANLVIPGNMSKQEEEKITTMAAQIFKILGCTCLARVDFFIDKQNGEIFFNEINTLPGFTSISLYPRLLEYSGITYTKLLDMLIDLAFKQYNIRCSQINNSIAMLQSISTLKRI